MSDQSDEGADDADLYVHGYTAIYFLQRMVYLYFQNIVTKDTFSIMFMFDVLHDGCVLHLATRSSDVDKHYFRETRQGFHVKFGGAFEHLLKLGDRPVEEHWLCFKKTTNEITQKVVGFRHRKQVVNHP